MTERCLIAASLAVLVFHPSSTIRCFKPKTSPNSSQRKNTTALSKPYRSLKKALSLTKSKKGEEGEDSRRTATSTSVSRTSSNLSGASPPAKPLSGEICDYDSVSELIPGRPLTCIVESIFRSGWAGEEEADVTVEKVLKVNNGVDVVTRFEEYREAVKSKAKEGAASLRSERLSSDGNEILMFHGPGSSICSCGVCRLFNWKCRVREETATSTRLRGSSWRAPEKAAAECIANGLSGETRKSVVLCKVIAGRVVRGRKHGLIDGEKGGFDSVLSSSEDEPVGSEELLVLNPNAILPCFVIIYNVREGTVF